MAVWYKLVGLSKGGNGRFSLEPFNKEGDVFWVNNTHMPYPRFLALFNCCEFNWDTNKYAEVLCDSLTRDGMPVNPRVINVTE